MSAAAGRMFEDPGLLRLVQPGALGVWNNNQAGQFKQSKLVLKPEYFKNQHQKKKRKKPQIRTRARFFKSNATQHLLDKKEQFRLSQEPRDHHPLLRGAETLPEGEKNLNRENRIQINTLERK